MRPPPLPFSGEIEIIEHSSRPCDDTINRDWTIHQEICFVAVSDLRRWTTATCPKMWKHCDCDLQDFLLKTFPFHSVQDGWTLQLEDLMQFCLSDDAIPYNLKYKKNLQKISKWNQHYCQNFICVDFILPTSKSRENNGRQHHQSYQWYNQG